MRVPLALLATATTLAVMLTGCSAPAPEPQASSGTTSELVEVSGDFGESPRVEFPTPLTPDETQCTELVEGDGERLVDGQQALIGLAVYNGRSGEEIQAPQGFGEGQGLLSACIAGLLEDLPSDTVLVLDTKSPEGMIALQPCMAAATTVIRGV